MKKLLVLFFCCCNYQLKTQNNEAVNAYIEQYKQLAIDEMIRTSVPASITLAQDILESNAGQCQLTEESIIILALNAKQTGQEILFHDDDAKMNVSERCADLSK